MEANRKTESNPQTITEMELVITVSKQTVFKLSIDNSRLLHQHQTLSQDQTSDRYSLKLRLITSE